MTRYDSGSRQYPRSIPIKRGRCWSAKHGGAVIFSTGVLNLYASTGHESGRYGFLVEDETINADGSREAVFERGTITMDSDGNVTGSLED